MSTLPSDAGEQELQAWLTENWPLKVTMFRELALVYNVSSQKAPFLKAMASLNKDPASEEKGPFEPLAETLMLFTGVLSSDGDKERAIRQTHQHYIVNTKGPIHEWDEQDAFDVFEWATEYASQFNIELKRETSGAGDETIWMTIDDEDNPVRCENWDQLGGISNARSLRDAGHSINQCRYGRLDVIPATLFTFEGNASKYNKFNAMWLADFSNLAYRKQAYVTEQLQQWKYSGVTWIKDASSDTQAFIATRDKYTVVCFRGTAGGKDVLTDIKFGKQPFFLDDAKTGTAGKAHRGFLDAMNSVWIQVLDTVAVLDADRPIFVSGHSLGAALAQLAAFRLAHAKHKVAGVYVYGSPRVGNGEFVAAYNELLGEQTFRHRNNDDIVAEIPPRWLGYRHTGQSARRFDEAHRIKIEGQDSNEEIRPANEDEAGRKLKNQVMNEIDASNEFLSIRDLRKAPVGISYGGPVEDFEQGFKDEHGSAQYLFKFACSIVDDKFNAMK